MSNNILKIGIIGAANIAIRSVIPAILKLNDKFVLEGIASRTQKKINDLSKIMEIITSIPGGLKSWLIVFIILQMTGIFVIDLGVRLLNLEHFIPIERKQ
jgi:hypothetical protein